MMERIKSLLLQSTISIRLFRFIEHFFYMKHENINDLLGIDSEELKKVYKKDGIVVIKNYFTKKQCEKVTLYIQKYQDDYEKYKNEGKFKAVDTKTNYTKEGSRAVFWYSFPDGNEVIGDMVNNFKLHSLCNYLTSSRTRKIVYWVKQVLGGRASNTSILTNECFHIDTVGLNAIRVLIYLNDIKSSENGPFIYMKTSHLKKPLMKRFYKPDFSRFYKQEATPIYGDAGDVVLVDVNGYHKAGRPLIGCRSTLQILYVSEAANYLNKIFNYTTYVKENESSFSL